MPVQDNLFTSFKESIDSYDVPERFTFPFYYQPHPLCLLAVEQLLPAMESEREGW